MLTIQIVFTQEIGGRRMRKIAKAVGVTLGVISFVVISAYVAMVYALWAITPKLEQIEEDNEDYSMWDMDID